MATATAPSEASEQVLRAHAEVIVQALDQWLNTIEDAMHNAALLLAGLERMKGATLTARNIIAEAITPPEPAPAAAAPEPAPPAEEPPPPVQPPAPAEPPKPPDLSLF